LEDAKKKADAEDKKIEFALKYLLPTTNAGKNLTLFCDSSKISQVIHNLLYNAIRFTPNGGMVNLSAGVIRRMKF